MDCKIVFSADKKLNKILNNVVSEIRNYSNTIVSQIKRLSEIGIALSSERDLNKLLDMIVDEAREFTNADGGTLYILKDETLDFEIIQNVSMGIRLGGLSEEKADFPPLKLDRSNVSAYAAIEKRAVNIPDVYKTDEFDFTGPKNFDEKAGYRSKSMLVVPLMNYEDEVIGVLQLINALDMESGEVIAFADEFVELTQSLASQAAIAITNVKLLSDIELLFESFITVMATAIDQRTPYNVNHTRRVVAFSILLAEEINNCSEGKFADVLLSDDELNELRIAAWLHDVGKVTTPEWVMDKAKKLEKIFDRIEFIIERFNSIKKSITIEAQEEKIKLLTAGGPDVSAQVDAIDVRMREAIGGIDADINTILKANEPGEFMKDEDVAAVKAIAAKRYIDNNGGEQPYLNSDELKNLTIRKGSITEEERKIMQDHATVTMKMLQKIPFTKKLQNVPTFAAEHHECLNGSGYPLGLKADQIPMQARIMAIADFYEALTAADRPYKKALPSDIALDIVGKVVKNECLDKDLFDLFVNNKVYEKCDDKKLQQIENMCKV